MEEFSYLYKMRHSAAHLLAMAVLDRFPDAKLGIGPVIDTGFYYDFELPRPLGPEDLPQLEEKMRSYASEDIRFEQKPITREDALAHFAHQPYKLELINDLPADETLTVYTSGSFTDLCRGPHVTHVREIGPIKLLSLAGAYWRGDEKRPMLQRVYGTAFPTQQELDDYLAKLAAAKERDHRKLGAELDLFTFSDLVGAGLPLFTPKGTTLRTLLVDYLQNLQKPLGYEAVWIPHITKPELYKVSGHWDKFHDGLFHVRGKHDEAFVMKPMNCPHHNQIYASRPRSYRDLPIRYAEVTTNYRDEQTGELHGLSRVRSLTQDDGHVYCLPEQVTDEVLAIYAMIQHVYQTFAMPLKVRLSLRDPENKTKYLGDDALWNEAEGQLKALLEHITEPSFVGIGEAAFYGPKLDFMATDAIGRDWQVATIQLDFNQPARFNLTYTDRDGQEKQPIMIHRAIYGSLERFLSILIEHYGGDFPLWLAPTQVAILPISDKVIEYAHKVQAALKKTGVRVHLDTTNESIGKKIRTSETQKIPLMLIIGQREAEQGTVAVRSRQDGDVGSLSLTELAERFIFTVPTAE